jgi:transposase
MRIVEPKTPETMEEGSDLSVVQE